MKTANRLLALSVLATGALFSTSTLACSTDAWATVTAGSTDGDPNTGVERFVGKCGLKVTGAGHVVDNTPVDEGTFIVRFYVFGKDIGAGEHTIFGAYSADDSTGEVFKITYDAGTIKVDANAAGGDSVSVVGEANKWNVVEVSWAADGNGLVWVNADATTETESATFTPGTGSIGSAALGAVTDIGSGMALFDDYVSHRSLAVGTALVADANGNGSLSIADAIALFNELGGTLATGQPDCNINGDVTIADAICLFNKL